MNVHSFMGWSRIMKTSDKRREVMQAALELIAEQGFHGAPMAEIAEKAGVAAGTIYRYFESKEVLITELHRELEEGIMAVLQKGYPAGRSLRERFLYLNRELLRYFITNPLHFRYMEQYFNSPYGITMHRDRLLGKSEHSDILKEIFEEGISQKILKKLPVVVLFPLAFGPMIILMRDHILGFITLDDPLIGQVTEASWDAIKR
jgi:TetR/AcrR family transcriptional regulator, repressor of fatR-cypB operon